MRRKVHVQAQELDSQPNKKPKKNGGEGCGCFIVEEFQATWLCVSGCSAAEIQVDFTEGPEILGTKAQRAILKRYITPRQICGKVRIHRKV